MSQLEDLYNQLKQYEVRQCKMVHEKVKMYNNAPLIHKVENGYECVRQGLCPKEIREFRLGCAHAISNYNFEKQLQELCDYGADFDEYRGQLSRLFFAIYALDHKKGELEKASAISFNDPERSAEIRNKIQDAIEKHNGLMEELEHLRTKVLSSIESLL